MALPPSFRLQLLVLNNQLRILGKLIERSNSQIPLADVPYLATDKLLLLLLEALLVHGGRQDLYQCILRLL